MNDTHQIKFFSINKYIPLYSLDLLTLIKYLLE